MRAEYWNRRTIQLLTRKLTLLMQIKRCNYCLAGLRNPYRPESESHFAWSGQKHGHDVGLFVGSIYFARPFVSKTKLSISHTHRLINNHGVSVSLRMVPVILSRYGPHIDPDHDGWVHPNPPNFASRKFVVLNVMFRRIGPLRWWFAINEAVSRTLLRACLLYGRHPRQEFSAALKRAVSGFDQDRLRVFVDADRGAVAEVRRHLTPFAQRYMREVPIPR